MVHSPIPRDKDQLQSIRFHRTLVPFAPVVPGPVVHWARLHHHLRFEAPMGMPPRTARVLVYLPVEGFSSRWIPVDPPSVLAL